jgi:hypothetical protein
VVTFFKRRNRKEVIDVIDINVGEYNIKLK